MKWPWQSFCYNNDYFIILKYTEHERLRSILSFFEFRKKLSALYIHLSNKVYTVNFIYISFSQYKNLRTLSGTLECVLNTN